MAAGYTELFLEQGSTFNTIITLDGNDGESFNLIGYTATSQMRKSFYSSNAAATFNVSTGDGVTGSIVMSLESANTANIAAGRYVYDVYVTSAAGYRSRVLEGIVNVSPQVTKTPGML